MRLKLNIKQIERLHTQFSCCKDSNLISAIKGKDKCNISLRMMFIQIRVKYFNGSMVVLNFYEKIVRCFWKETLPMICDKKASQLIIITEV